MKKKSIRLCLGAFLTFNVLYAFPETQSALPKKGRTVMLESIRKISDDGIELIFKAPRGLCVDEEGAIYFAEGPFVYKFADGRMVSRIGKLGQGPGECQWVSNFVFHQGTLYIQSSYPPKILVFSKNGAYLKEYKSEFSKLFWALFSINGELYGMRDEMKAHMDRLAVDGDVESEFSINRISPDFKDITRFFDVSVPTHVAKGAWERTVLLNVAVYDPYLFVLHSDKYRIERIDMRSGRVDKTIARRFVSRKNEFDIIRICSYGNKLLAITSERAGNGIDRLVDVYDIQGNLLDAFYLRFPDPNEDCHIGSPVVSKDGILSILQENQDDGLLSIGQYRIR